MRSQVRSQTGSQPPEPSPPRVRIVQRLACPWPTCGFVAHRVWARDGTLWLRCDRDRVPAGASHWWLNITLPAGATIDSLIDVVGVDFAAALLALAGVPTYVLAPLGADPAEPVHVQVPVRGRDVRQLRFAPLADVLRVLSIL